MRCDLTLTCDPPDSFRAAKIAGMFDVPTGQAHPVQVRADLPIEDKPWNIGAIIGSSGAGKSVMSRQMFPGAYTESGAAEWKGACLLDDFPEGLTPDEICQSLTAVGFSSVPAWMRPYRTLSTGQKFRADLARTLISSDFTVFDEYTSTVDRDVAKAASVAVSKYVRRTDRQFVAVTCHRDILTWLQTDWWYDADTREFHWGCLQRPPIGLCVREGLRQAWGLFRRHHYLTGDLNPSCRVFLAYATFDGVERLAGFFSILPVMGKTGWSRGHRTVVLPDFQGMGIGNVMIEEVAEQLWERERRRFSARTAALPLIHHRRRHPEMWRLREGPSHTGAHGATLAGKLRIKVASDRLTTSWVYIPKALRV